MIRSGDARVRTITRWLPTVLAAVWMLAGVVQAAPRAWLDRDRIAFGETTTLNIESDDATATPDWAPLAREFELSGHSSRRQVEIRDGRQTARTLHGVALRPRREGLLTVPAVAVGNARTAPLQLSVGPAVVSAARDGAPAFVEAEVDAQSPYVQQAVAYTLRLYYAVPLVSGQLEQPAPEGASLQRIGSDTQYSRDIDGRRYTVVERRFLLVPERSGPLTVPGATFEGRSVSGGMFDGLFNRGPRALSANGPPSLLSVRPMPAGAGPDWLPVHAVRARWLEAATDARAGTAASFVFEAVFDGATGTQMPEVALPAVDGAQVFADPPRYDETFDEGRPQVRLTRRFSLVPAGAGTLRIASPVVTWWDVGAGTPRTSSAPEVTLQVTPGVAAARGPGTADATADVVSGPGGQPAGTDGGWRAAAGLFALLWLLTLGVAIWLHRRRRSRAAAPRVAPTPTPTSGRPLAPRQLLDLLRAGEPSEIDRALGALVVPTATDLDALQRRLDDPGQREAVAGWQRARWAGDDLVAARNRLRDAFRKGVRVVPAPAAEEPPGLPPLYPRR